MSESDKVAAALLEVAQSIDAFTAAYLAVNLPEDAEEIDHATYLDGTPK